MANRNIINKLIPNTDYYDLLLEQDNHSIYRYGKKHINSNTIKQINNTPIDKTK